MAGSFREAVDAISKTFLEGYNKRDRAAVTSTYAEGARIVWTNGRRIEGRKALEAALDEAFTSHGKCKGFEITKATADGNTGYSVQIVTFVEGKAYAMSAYARDAGGNWLVDDEVAVTLA